MRDITIRRCGVKFQPPAIVLCYFQHNQNKLRRRTIPIRGVTNASNVQKLATELKEEDSHHSLYVRALGDFLLEKLLTVIRDNLKGVSLEASLSMWNEVHKIDPDEDLNKADDETLRQKKLAMEQSFAANRLRPDDEGYVYDKQVEFSPAVESGWDEGDSNEEDFF